MHDIRSRVALVAATTAAALVVTAAAQPPSSDTTTAPPATTPATSSPPTTAAPAPRPIPPARRALPKDPEALSAAGRNAAGVIVSTSPELDGVPVTSEPYLGAAHRRERAATDLATARLRVAAATATIERLNRERWALAELTRRAEARDAKLAAREVELRAAVRQVAMHRYIHDAGDDLYPDPYATVDELMARTQQRRVTSEASDSLAEDLATVVRRRDDVRAERDRWGASNDEAALETDRTTDELQRAKKDAAAAAKAVAAAEKEMREARTTTTVAGSDLPLVALDAYWRAAADLAATRPACGITWALLAGIGRTESDHGRYFGGQLGADGATSIPIVGIPLDGTNETAAVPDSDTGELDGDPTWDRAVGVMQFIPMSWRRYAEDQSGDRRPDPQNVYDAALAAAKLLCSRGGSLTDPTVLHDAIFSYNRSEAYVAIVLQRAQAYGTLPVPAAP